MALVLLIAVGLLVSGYFMGASRIVQGSLLTVLFGAVLAVQIGLPAGHPLREATGGSLRAWLIFAVVVGLAAAYTLVLKHLKSRAIKPDAPQQDGPFSDAELERYARHIVMREIGGAGQQRLKAARVLVIGAGGLGSPALLYLAAAGVGTIGVVDDDTVSLSNMQRQILHAMDRIGMAKVFSAQQGIAAINPHVEVLPYNRRLDAGNAHDLFEGFDLVLDGSDNFATRHLVNETCVALGVPLISAAITQWEGQISLYHPASGAPCYACIFPEIPAEGLAPSCAEAGVMGALPGVVGSMMAVEAIKHITGAGPTLKGELLIYDALYGESRKMRMERRDGCKVCGST
ncbi:MAG: molybdopterin-synthase adenylyltransferase MoeB [Alphaproteobacteria bacterium]|nr:molybdopterin-synthase adenylyltransferase MoeB [Alphaproteobacteria bacterium]